MKSKMLSKRVPPFFTVSIDVEADNVWGNPASMSVKNLSALPEFQRLCDENHVIPTYLLSYEVLSNKKFVSFLRDTVKYGKCEIGIHPHVWTIPPFITEKNGVDMSILKHYQSMLDENILIKKLETLQKTIQDKIGISPTAHRAGRWGLCLRTVAWLEREGYISDSSIVPYKSFPDSTLDSKIYPNYYQASALPYRMSARDIMKSGSLQLVEVPVTNINRIVYPAIIEFSDRMKNKCGGVRIRNLLDRLSMYPLELRPYPEYSAGTLPEIAKIALKKGLPIINLMFHSSELFTGGSPYSSNEMKTSRIWKHIEEMFAFVKHNNLIPSGISDAVVSLKERKYFEH